MAEDSLTPIAILIDQLKNEDTQTRLNAVRRVSAIAKALGPERTRKELIHFLTESVDDEDEVLLALAEELGGFVEYVGGVEHASSLLPPLESLAASVEETTVREKAVDSLNKIAEVIPAENIRDTFVLLLKRLASGDWFTSKTSACGLFAVAYRRSADEHKKELRTLFYTLCKDETPMVRRAAATHFGALIRQMDKQPIKDEVLPVFSPFLANDEQDSVRLLTVDICSAIGSAFTHEENVQYVLPVAMACATDKSWRVRYMVADRFCDLAKALGPEITKTHLVSAFSKLLKDNEPEVRTAAAFKVQGFASQVPVDLITKQILPGVRELVHDQSQHVRAALASNIMGLAPILQKEKTIEYLIDIFLALLKDEFPDVRLNIIAKLDAVNSVGIDLLAQSLLPAIVDLAEDRQWRVRLAIIEYIPLLGSQLGIQFFDEKLSNLCLTWLGDSVFAIREAAALNVKKLAEVFGTEWAKNNIIPKVLSLYTHPNYLYRMTTLFCIGQLAPVVGADVTISVMLPLVVRMVKDPVPNIRFNAAKILHGLVPLLDGTVVQSHIKPVLNQLYEDQDRDVKHYASLALQAC